MSETPDIEFIYDDADSYHDEMAGMHSYNLYMMMQTLITIKWQVCIVTIYI